MPDLHFYRRVLSIACLGAAAVSLAACDVVINSMDGEFGGGRFKAEKTWSKTFAVNARGASLEIKNVSGKIDVAATDGTAIEVEAVITAKAGSEEAARENLKDAEIKADASATRVRLETYHPKTRRNIEVKYTVRVPRTVKLDIENVSGSIEMKGVQAGIRAETTNGAVKGRLLGGFVEASTTNGSVDIEMAAVGSEGVRLETTNGGITLSLPADAKATLEARCVNGGVTVSDLPFEKDADNNRRKVDGKINGGGATLKLETVNGGVRVKAIGVETKPGGGDAKPGKS